MAPKRYSEAAASLSSSAARHGQGIQQPAIVGKTLAVAHLFEKTGQGRLDPPDRRREGLRFGQAEQRHGAIGLDFQKPLHQCAALGWAEPAILDKDAHETMRVRPEIR